MPTAADVPVAFNAVGAAGGRLLAVTVAPSDTLPVEAVARVSMVAAATVTSPVDAMPTATGRAVATEASFWSVRCALRRAVGR